MELANKIGASIVLSGEPKSTSHIYLYHCQFGSPRGYMSRDGRELKESYQWQAKSQWRGAPSVQPLRIEATLYFGTKRKSDIDNFNKIWIDSLAGIVWEDDSQIVELALKKQHDKKSPRIEVLVYTLS